MSHAVLTLRLALTLTFDLHVPSTRPTNTILIHIYDFKFDFDLDLVNSPKKTENLPSRRQIDRQTDKLKRHRVTDEQTDQWRIYIDTFFGQNPSPLGPPPNFRAVFGTIWPNKSLASPTLRVVIHNLGNSGSTPLTERQTDINDTARLPLVPTDPACNSIHTKHSSLISYSRGNWIL